MKKMLKFDQPLQQVKSYHPSFRVETRLHEMLWKNTFTENEITLEILSLCSQMEFRCKRNYTKPGKGGVVNDTLKLEYENKFKPHAHVEFRKMNEKLQQLPSPQPSLKEFMRMKRLDVLFPKLWSYFMGRPCFHNQKSTISGYFDCLASLNQLKMMSHQINTDLHNLVNHKYMAHQTALLYHAISEVGSPMKDYKQEVEELFADVKESLKVEEGQVPHLPAKEKVRLDTMTSALMHIVDNFSEELTGPLDPVLNFVQRNI